MTNDYTMLLFDWDDTVSAVQLVRAETHAKALAIAAVINLAYPRLAGYQLWLQGRRVASTFPQDDGQAGRAVSVAAAAARRAG